MKLLKNTLYVTTQGSYLSKDGEAVQVRCEGKVLMRVPIHNLEGIVCFGGVSCSPYLMALCGERQVALSFLSESGRFLARVMGPVSGNVLLRRQHYRWADDEAKTAEIARSIVIGKVFNSRMVLQKAARDRSPADAESLQGAARHLGGLLKQLSKPLAINQLRGLEGEAARRYFEAFNAMMRRQKDDFAFRRRTRRPPMDALNALLSFLYTLLAHDVRSALEAVGLDPAVGFLHRDRPGRPGLALDLMEELRPFWADRLALSLINQRQLTAEGFEIAESGAVRMEADTRKTVLTAYQNRKREEIMHPFLEEKVSVGLLPHLQAALMARRLRGDLDAYPPFAFR